MLQVVIHEDALASLIAVTETFSAAIEKSKVTSVSAGKMQRKRSHSSTWSLSSLSTAVSKSEKRKGLTSYVFVVTVVSVILSVTVITRMWKLMINMSINCYRFKDYL